MSWSAAAVHPRTGRSPTVSRYRVAAWPVPDTSGSAFRTCTGWSPASPAVSRHPVVVYRDPDTSGRHIKLEPVSHRLARLCAGSRWWSARSRSTRNRQPIPGPFRFGPAQGPESACLSQITLVRLRSGGSSDDRSVLRHPVRPTRQPKIQLHFRGSIVNRANLGLQHTILSVGLHLADLLTSVPQTSGLLPPLVGSPPLPRKENTRSRAPNCSSEGGRQQHKHHTIYYFMYT